MFTLLQPYWLWASAAITLPIFIHLWNVKQGKIRQVGSISFILQSDRQQAKSLRLKDLILLLIRCLLIILLALLLAKPQYTKPLSVQSEKGWMLIEKAHVKVAYDEYKPLIDSLNNVGFQFHYFENGFKKEAFTTALQQVDSTQQNSPANYWQLLAQLNQEVPAQLPVYLFTSNELTHFKGSRPIVNLNLQWQTINSNDTSSKYVVNAYENVARKFAVRIANSTDVGTSIESQQWDPNALPSSFMYNHDSNYLSYLASTLQTKITVDTLTLNVCIYAGKFANDAAYIKAALDAIKTFGDYKISYKFIKNLNEISNRLDWFFWLSDEAIPQTISAKNIFRYARGKEVSTASWLVFNDHSIKQDEGIHLSKIIQPGNQPLQQKIWTDGYGNPILTVTQIKETLYTFYSRFNPEWNGLVWNPYFPEMLLSFLYPHNTNTIYPNDKRVVESSQFLPKKIVSGNDNKQKLMQVVPLDKWFWLFAFFLFSLERLLSFKRKKEALYG